MIRTCDEANVKTRNAKRVTRSRKALTDQKEEIHTEEKKVEADEEEKTKSSPVGGLPKTNNSLYPKRKRQKIEAGPQSKFTQV